MTHLSLGSFLRSMIRRKSMRYRIVQPDCVMAMGLAPLISWCGWLVSALIRRIAAITFALQLTWQMLLAMLASSCKAIRISTSILVFRMQFGRFIISKSFMRSLGFRCDKVSGEHLIDSLEPHRSTRLGAGQFNCNVGTLPLETAK